MFNQFLFKLRKQHLSIKMTMRIGFIFLYSALILWDLCNAQAIILMEGTNTRDLVEDRIIDNFEEYIPEHFERVGDKYYYFKYQEAHNWFGAAEKCRQVDGHLINLQNESELLNVAPKLISSQEYWTDINNFMNMTKFFSLTTGRETNMLKVDYSNPEMNMCGVIKYDPANSNFMLTKQNCFQKKNFICETTQPTTISFLLW